MVLGNFECHIELDPKLKPKIQGPHKIALFAEYKTKEELDYMENHDIIDMPEGPT